MLQTSNKQQKCCEFVDNLSEQYPIFAHGEINGCENNFFLVGTSNYTLILNGETIATIEDQIGHDDIIKMRAYGGYFSEYYLDRNDDEIAGKYVIY